MKEINITLIGAGNWGRSILKRLRKSDRFKITGIVDTNFSNLTKSAIIARSLRIFKDADRLIQNKHTHAIAIALPNHLHSRHLKDILEAGKHIFVEKPVVNKIEELETIEKLISTNKVFMIGHDAQYNPVYQRLKRLIQTDAIGKIEQVNILRTIPRNYTDWRNDPNQCHSGVLSQLGIHTLDFIKYVFDETPTKINANNCIFRNNLIEARFSLDGKIHFDFTVSFLRDASNEIDIIGSKGKLRVINGSLYGKNGLIKKNRKDSISLLMDAFAYAIIGKEPIKNDFRWAKQLMILNDKIYQECMKKT